MQRAYVGEFKTSKGQREVHGASSWTLKVNAVEWNSYEGHSTRLAQGSTGMQACEVVGSQLRLQMKDVGILCEKSVGRLIYTC
jgi:hypothetical protein